MREVLSVLLEMNVYAAIIWAAIMALRKLAGGRMSPTLRLALWTLLLARLVCPMTFDTGVHLLPETPPPAALQAEAQDAAAAPATGADPFKAQAPRQDALPTPDAQARDAEAGHAGKPAFRTEDLWTVLGAVWIGGMAVLAAWDASGYLRLRHRIRHGRRHADERLEAIFLQCCRRLGIRRLPRLLETGAVRGPALLVPRTVLYPPDAGAMSDEHMRMSMMHELMHYKRRDWVLPVVCLAVRVAHWFNPVVWLAERDIRADIEAACDGDVVAGWSQAEKADYARTILLLYGTGGCCEGLVPFAANRCEEEAEERIRRIFMPAKSSRKTRLVALVAAGVLALTCFTTACQQVPARAATDRVVAASVDVKAPAPFERAVEPAPDATAPAVGGVVPEPAQTGSWHTQVTMPDGILDIDAAVFLPDARPLPVYSIERAQGSPEMARKVADVLWGDDMPEFRARPAVTEEERDRIVAHYAELIRKYEEEGPDPDETMSAEERVAQFRDAIRDTEAAYQESVSGNGMEAADFSAFTWKPDMERYGLEYDVLFPEGTAGQLAAWQADEDHVEIGASVSYLSQGWGDETFAGFSGSLRDAIEDASAKAAALGGLWTLDRAVNDTEMGCAYISFLRSVGTVPMIDGRMSSATMASVLSPELSEAVERGEYEWPPNLPTEYLKMWYDDTGLVGFLWNNPWTVTGTVDQDPGILTVEDAQNIFATSFADSNADSIPAGEINVERVELGYAYSFAKDAPGEYRLIPVYDFIGTTTTGHPMSFMTVNALDGSLYQRDLSM